MSAKEDDKVAPECASEQEREWAQTALTEFNNKNYISCLQNLHKIENRTQDLKILHNKHVAEYYKNDFKKTEMFQRNLSALCAQFDLNAEKLDEVDHCVALYNQAVLYYHGKQYTSALKILDRLYKFIEPMDETLGRQVGLLLVELYISVKQIDKALNLITYLNNHALNQATPTTVSTTKVPVKYKQIEKEKKPPLPITKATEDFIKQLDRYRIRCNLLNHSLQITRSDLQNLHSINKEDNEVLFLMANQEYLQGNFQAAIKLLTTIPNEAFKLCDSGESSTILFYNNMGVIHHAMGKPNLACMYYQKALNAEREDMPHGEPPLYLMGSSRYHEIIYNLGISLLFSGKPVQAFDCLVVAVRRYHRNSRLWLRLAECCIKAHKESNRVDFERRSGKDVIDNILGSGRNRKVVLNTKILCDKKYSTESQSFAIPMPTLEFATLCLRNARLLLPSDTTTPPVALLLLPGTTPPQVSINPSSSPSSPLGPAEVASLKNTILAASAYVALCLGDYIVALEHAKELLGQAKISQAHRLLGNLYIAECLVFLNKLSEAVEYLNPENYQDLDLDLPDDDKVEEIPVKTKPPTVWFPDNLQNAMLVMQYNLAVVKTLKGQLEQALGLLKQIWQMKVAEKQIPPPVIMLVLYIELKLGHVDVARNLIKQHSERGLSG